MPNNVQNSQPHQRTDTNRSHQCCPESGTECTLSGVLEALNDPDARAILQATTDGPRSTSEIAEDCDLALSTTYRKIDTLVECGLLEKSIDFDDGCNHINRYAHSVDAIQISLDDGRLELSIADGGSVEK